MKKRVVLIMLSIVMFALLGCQGSNPDAENIDNDALRFKIEHEVLNGEASPDNPERIFKEMYIPEDNPFRYVEYDEIIELLEDGTGIIYLGFPTCPWCRNFVPVLVEAAIEFGVEEILYRDILDDRNILELEDGEIVEVRAGDTGYYQLLEALGDIAPEYTGLDDDSIRRIFVPTLIFVKDGEVINFQESLPSFQERVSGEELGGWLPMNDEEIAELTAIFMTYFGILFGNE